MKKKNIDIISVFGIILSVCILVLTFGLLREVKEFFETEPEIIDNSLFYVDGAMCTYGNLPDSELKFSLKLSDSYYSSLQSENSDIELGALVISESSLGDNPLSDSTGGVAVTVFNDALSESQADNMGYYSLMSDSFSVSSLEENYICVGYVKNGDMLQYTESLTRNVMYILERAYLDSGSETVRETIYPYLSEAFKAEYCTYSIGYDTLGSGSNLSIDFNGPSSAIVGETVSFTITVHDYQVYRLVLCDNDSGEDIEELTAVNGIYSFTMPEHDVTVF